MVADPLYRRAAGDLILAGFPGECPPPELTRALQEQRLGGVILFRPNISSLEQVAALNASIQAAAPDPTRPLLIAVDEEGGKVSRLRGLITDLPAMGALGRLEDAHLTFEAGHLLGRELRSLGFNTDFAPVCDVHTCPDNPIIGDRSFSSDPRSVRRLAVAFARGLTAGGVLACAKHFPGHGDTRVDSHVDLPVVNHGRERLTAVEWPPFEGAIAEGVPLIMTAHLLVPALDRHLPATLSRTILTDVLRHDLGFTGVIVSDDLEMGALRDRYGVEELVTLGLEAGLDLFLFCHSPQRQSAAFDTLVHLAERDPKACERILDSAERVRAVRSRLATMERTASFTQVVRCPEHRAWKQDIERRLAACHT